MRARQALQPWATAQLPVILRQGLNYPSQSWTWNLLAPTPEWWDYRALYYQVWLFDAIKFLFVWFLLKRHGLLYYSGWPELLTSSEPPASVFQIAGATASCHAWLLSVIIIQQELFPKTAYEGKSVIPTCKRPRQEGQQCQSSLSYKAKASLKIKTTPSSSPCSSPQRRHLLCCWWLPCLRRLLSSRSREGTLSRTHWRYSLVLFVCLLFWRFFCTHFNLPEGILTS